jgi:hypothetical protein
LEQQDMKYLGVLHNAQQGKAVLERAYEVAKPWLVAGHKLQVIVKQEARSSDQNAKFHAICSDLERSCLPWCGLPRTAAEWKVLLVSGHAIATKEGCTAVTGIEGEMVNIRESTSMMSKARGSSLIEYALAFCAEHGVRESFTTAEMAQPENLR